MEKRCIITSASDKFFPSLINFLGSLHVNYPEHPTVNVYDLGLADSFKKELRSIKWINILTVPHFAPHWRSCYTWKTYILNTPLAESNLYIDAGCQILRPLDELFEEIESSGYMLVSQGLEVKIAEITPPEYIELLNIKSESLEKEVVAAGLVGFKIDSVITPVMSALYASGVEGLCLGFSPDEQWKNKGVNKTLFIRNCPRFRHDTTMFSLLVRKMILGVAVHPIEEFSGDLQNNSKQYLWNFRMNFSNLEFVNSSILHTQPSFTTKMNRAYIGLFLILKKINRRLKKL